MVSEREAVTPSHTPVSGPFPRLSFPAAGRSVLQVLHGCCERALKAVVIPGGGLEWAQHYHQHVESDRFCLNEWEAMNDLESVRRDSEVHV